MTYQFKVTVKNIPEELTISEIKNYLQEAVSTWRGSLHPDDSIFHMKADDFKVTRIRIKKEKQ